MPASRAAPAAPPLRSVYAAAWGSLAGDCSASHQRSGSTDPWLDPQPGDELVVGLPLGARTIHERHDRDYTERRWVVARTASTVTYHDDGGAESTIRLTAWQAWAITAARVIRWRR